uniref:Uncharacterized protein DDB_G0267764-like isoform X2 n=1 Tax=Dermatophagoides pteronyssinus TaxID=6956 RepID=A0A6P6XUW5_DERPT|nr:uncharacterized protein DDB_G0267764-like isoform X2 [Dermatophagoides pteronyssinus]
MRIYTIDEKTMIKSSSSSSSSHLNNNNPLQSTHQNGFNSTLMMTKQQPLSSSSTTLDQSSSSISNSITKVKSKFENNGGGDANVSRVNIPIVFNKNRGQISMYRFINTKGKKMNKNQNGGGGGFNRNNFNHHHQHYFDDSNDYDGGITRPSSKATTAAAIKYVINNHNFYKKRISAIDKIQEELREMKLREDELKCQRIRSIGISYPNLNSICDDDYSTSDDQTSEDNKDSFHSRCSSNPDLLNGNHLNNHNNNHSSSPSPSSTSSSSSSSYTIAIVDINNTNNSNNNSTITSSTTTLSSDTSDSLLNDCGLKIGGPRRKIPLIAIWEQKINECQTNGDTITTTTTTATTNNQNIKDQ